MILNLDEEALNIFTDGSSLPKPRRGGVGLVFVYTDTNGDEQTQVCELPGYKNATNNEMELNACVLALQEAAPFIAQKAFRKIVIYTDSRYVVENVSRAKFQWPKNGWNRRHGQPVANALLWKQLRKELSALQLPVHFKWVKGHSGNVHNKRADKAARASARAAINPPLTVRTVRRKKTTRSLESGSVRMCGQRIRIRLITDEYLPLHKLYKYKYEVQSKRSKYFGNVDTIYSGICLKAGHDYDVTFNKDTDNPRIVHLRGDIT